MTVSDWLSLLLTAIPTALVGFVFGWVERKLTKLDERSERNAIKKQSAYDSSR